jgi:hypothetical protein
MENIKKIALISTYCDTQEKLDVLEKNIDNIKKLSIDVMVISPIFLPQYIQTKCDYFFLTKDNPVLDWPQKAMQAWKNILINGKPITITRTYADYGWAGLFQVKKLSELALTLDYDYFYHMIYDLKFDETVIEGLTSEGECNIYSIRKDNQIWEIGLHFMVFNRENLQKFIPHITLENYLIETAGIAESWLLDLKSIFPYNIIRKPVEDEIYYYEGHDFFNFSPIAELPFFIIKDDELLDNIKLLFYLSIENVPFQIMIDNIILDEVSENFKIIDLGFNKLSPKSVQIIYNETVFDITDTINKLKHSTCRFN